ncbi:MAG: hypothetical protein OXN91_02105 [Chloroflexota bacterium]|nr:hypothetical protein [Chloroflexota bacterium]
MAATDQFHLSSVNVHVHVAFIREGDRRSVDSAVPTFTDPIVSWASIAAAQVAGQLPWPPEAETWRRALEGLGSTRAVYLAPGYGPDDDPGVAVLQDLARRGIVSLTLGPESSPAVDGPTVMGAAGGDWRPAPGMQTVVRGVADDRELNAWQSRLRAAYGSDAIIEVKPWSCLSWQSDSPVNTTPFPMSLRALPTEKSRLRDTDTLLDIFRQLRGPDGCPWDKQQTHRTLRPYLAEEAHEALAAIERDDDVAMADEFGDVLANLVLHAEIARQRGGFDWPDVVAAISAKMIRRHPHVFGDAQFEALEDLHLSWAQIKAAERVGDQGPFDGLSDSMPSLTFARSAVRALRRAGQPLDMPSLKTATLAALAAGSDAERLGDALLWVAARADAADVDPDMALRDANARLRKRLEDDEGRS